MRSRKFRTWPWGLVAGLLGLTGWVLAMSPPAHFERGQDRPVTTAPVGPQGATLRTGRTGTPIDDITVEIPAGALDRDTTVTLSYNTGTLTLPSGNGSGVLLKLTAQQVQTFQQLVTIRVHYDAQLHAKVAVVGYAIDDQDRLRAVNTESQIGRAHV